MTACCSSTTSKVRRGFIPLVVATAVCTAAFVSGPNTVSTRPATDPALLFPSGTVLTLSLDGGPCTEFGKELALSKIWHEPEVQDFAKSATEFVHEMVDTNVKQFAEQLGLKPEELYQLAKIKLSLGMTRFQKPKDGDRSPKLDLMLAADLRGSQKALEALLKILEAQISSGMGEDALNDTKVAGLPAKQVRFPSGGPFSSVVYFVNDGWLIAGTDQTQLEAAVARAKSGDPAGSLLSDAAYASSMKEVLRPKTIFSLSMDYAAFIDVVASMESDVADMRSMGLDALKYLGFGVDLEGGSIHERGFVAMTPNSPLTKLTVPMDTAALLARIPKRSIAAYATSINFKEYFDYTVKTLRSVPMVNDQLDEGLKEIDKALGSEWRTDLLANLGPEVAAYVAMPQYGLVPDAGALIKVGNRAKVEGIIAKMLDRPEVKGAHRSFKYGDATINYLDLGTMKIDRDLNARPTWMFVDDYLFVTYCPNSAKSFLAAAAAKDGGLVAREDFAKTFGRLKAESPNAGNLGVGYLDFQWVVGFLLDNAIPLVQTAAPTKEIEELEPVRIDVGKIPSTQTITKHLSCVLMQTQTKEGGYYVDMVSPTGFVGMFVTLGAVGGWMTARAPHEIETAVPVPANPPKPKDDDEPK